MAGPTDELSTLREHLERYRGVTLQTLDMVSEEKLRWYPTQSQFSFAEQFVHIAQVEDFYAHGLLSGDWDKSRLELPKERQTHETLRRKLEETRKFTMAKLDALDAARLNMIVSVPDVPVKWSLRSWLWYKGHLGYCGRRTAMPFTSKCPPKSKLPVPIKARAGNSSLK